ncbi:MAG: hypothetical protein ACI977_000401 [Candidatus Nanohaloarchaea archaeon]|jgi:hypothetical protein
MNFQIKPDEHDFRDAKDTVESTLETCQYTLEREENFEVNIGSYPGKRGARGLAEAFNLQIYFNPDVEGWQDELRQVVQNYYAKSWFYEKHDPAFFWEEVLASSLGLMFLEEAGFDRKPEEVESAQAEWEDKKDLLPEEVFNVRTEFSWQLNWLIGKQILEKHDLEDFAELTKKDVVKAGDSIGEVM